MRVWSHLLHAGIEVPAVPLVQRKDVKGGCKLMACRSYPIQMSMGTVNCTGCLPDDQEEVRSAAWSWSKEAFQLGAQLADLYLVTACLGHAAV